MTVNKKKLLPKARCTSWLTQFVLMTPIVGGGAMVVVGRFRKVVVNDRDSSRRNQFAVQKLSSVPGRFRS